MRRPPILPAACAAALVGLPGLAHASGAPDLGWIMLAALVYAVVLVLHLAACAVAMRRARSWRPLLVLPLSITFTVVLAGLVGSIRAPEVLGLPTTWLVFPLPFLAIPLALLVYRDLVRERPPSGSP